MSTDLSPSRTPIGPAPAPQSADDVALAFLLGYSGNTRAAYLADLRGFFSFCEAHGCDPLQATRAHIDLYARYLDEHEHRSSATVARKLSVLAGFYRYATNEELIIRNPVALVRRPKVGSVSTSTGLDIVEMTALITAAQDAGPRSHALVLLLALNGLRVSEAIGAAVDDLSVERGHRVLYVTRKGGTKATVPLAPRTAEALDAYLAGRTSGPLFVTSTGRAMDRVAAFRLIRRLAKSACIARPIHPHDLRHAFVTLSLDAGASLRDVQDAAGHADPRTTRRYDRARHNLDKHPTYALAGLV